MTGPRLVKANAEPWESGPPPGRFDDVANDAAPPSTSGSVRAEKAKHQTAADLVRARIGMPIARRAVTGIPTLDANTRNGLPEGKIVIVGGAPGAGKTTLATQCGYDAAKSGWAVLLLVADGSIEDVLQRLAQLEGFTRDEWDANDADALTLFAEKLEALPLIIADTDDACAYLEDASEALKAARGAKPSMLVLDSVQTVRSLAGEMAESPRARIDATTTVIKRCARHDGHLVIATSELARGAYRSKNAADNIDDLAAFKESGGIEYAADLAIVLRSVKDEDLVDVTTPKSRIGAKTNFRLRLDRRHMRLTEVAVDQQDEERRREDADDAQIDSDAEAIFRFLLEHPGIAGEGKLRTAMREAGTKVGNARIGLGLERLRRTCRLDERTDRGKPRWFAKNGESA